MKRIVNPLYAAPLGVWAGTREGDTALNKRHFGYSQTYKDFETQKLNAEEERALFAELASNRSDSKVRDRVARAFLGFALAQARKDFRGRSLSASLKSGLSLDDAVSAANFGLMHAINKFDHTRGIRFTTYAGHWIGKYLREARYSAHAVTVSRGDRERFVIYKRQAAQGLDADEIAELNETTRADVERVLALAGGRQDPIEMFDRGDTNRRQASGDEELEPSVADAVEKAELMQRLEAAKLRLGSLQNKLLHDRFFRKLSIKQIAKKRGVSIHVIEDELKSIYHVLRFNLQA
jgi:RNA polymerase sigma factor (sigma-70 family)